MLQSEEHFNTLLQDCLRDFCIQRRLEQINRDETRRRYQEGQRSVTWSWLQWFSINEDLAQRAGDVAQKVRQILLREPVDEFNAVCVTAEFDLQASRHEMRVTVRCTSPFW